jgi:hypothetical protein
MQSAMGQPRLLAIRFVATGGDVAIQRVEATMTIGGTTGSANLNKYVSEVESY